MLQIDTLPAYTPLSDTTALTHSAAGIVLDSTIGEPVPAAPKTDVVCAYDTIFTPLEAREPVLHKSLFTHHELQVKSSHEKSIMHEDAPGWFFGVIALALFLIFNFLRRKQINLIELLQSAIDHRALDRLLRDSNLTHPSAQAPIALIMILPLSLMGYYFFMPHGSKILADILTYALVFLVCFAAYFTRNGVMRIVGDAFSNNESVSFYLASNYIFHLLYAIVGAVMAFFVCYTGEMGQTFFYITLALLGALMVVRFIRGMQIILTLSKTSKFYLFYYLCILEIVPVVIIAKVATSL